MSYRDTKANNITGQEGHSWEQFTHGRLVWLYGAERASRIRAGQDDKTNRDLEAWNSLGRPHLRVG